MGDAESGSSKDFESSHPETCKYSIVFVVHSYPQKGLTFYTSNPAIIMKFLVLLVSIPALVSSMHIDNSAGLDGGNAKSSSRESTRPQIRAPNAARSTGMANPQSTSLTKIGSSEPSTESPRTLKLASKSTQDGQTTSPLPIPSNQAETSSSKSAGSKSRLRRHISDSRAFESYLIHKRADKVPAKNLLRTFIDDINPTAGSKPAGPTTAAPSAPESSPSGSSSSAAVGSKPAQAVSTAKPAPSKSTKTS
ncbi:hypothetical protein PGT21_022471 [Puccinia graminis f. sp. tritici]|uniref:Uncharacterized protein n=1 Tax=Puccinia graminis f. sp. tritici TaxID=56615 RepID=A0A5B0PY69_PUCGR|nr:hypothetical protein PGT21_022471 [Puccinia graminis f. sp. tritici]KAA1131663.1 hypothetical protein PGTUg99_034977 [Puccinia graminis f. sp. tritici]